MSDSKPQLEVMLKAISPVAFIFAKEGDKLLIKRNAPKLREYRDKIGPANESYLAFKGETKIGMIPLEFIKGLGNLPIKRVCKISRMEKIKDIIEVELFIQAADENK